MHLLTFILFVCGLALLVVGAELMVRGAARMAEAAGISPLVVGLTVVAYGTSAPEVAVSVQSAWEGQADIAVGNVVGSNIANILLVLGISAVIAPLMVSRQIVRSSVPIMIGVSVLMLLMGLDGRIVWWEGLILLAGAAGFTWLTIYRSRREIKILAAVQAEEAAKAQTDEQPAQAELRLSARRLLIDFLLIVVGLAALVLGARWLVAGAVVVAQWLGVSQLVIGLTVVAIGTSLPEIATTIVAAARGHRDIAVGNAVGSNIFNVLLVIGIAAAVSPKPITVTPEALWFDLPVMIAVAVVSLPICFSGWRIDRLEGAFFLVSYTGYLTYLYLASTHSSATRPFAVAMLAFVLPLFAVMLVVNSIRYTQRSRARDDSAAE